MAILGMHYTQDPTDPEAYKYTDWVRMWDNEVYWNRIHYGVDKYNWGRLDYLVNDLYAGKEIVYCIGGTPQWLAQNPNQSDYKPWMGEGSNSLPSDSSGGTDSYGDSFSKGIDEWNKFCYVLADRYKGRIKAYEFWNEPQLLGYMAPWDSTTRNLMAKMIKRGAGTVKSVDSNAITIGPSIFVGTSGRVSRATKIVEALAGTQSSFGPWENLDAMACHIYPAIGDRKTEWRRQLDENRSIISSNGGPSKTWITETNYNLLGEVLPENETTYNLVSDTYDEAGGKFIFWYAYDRTADLGGLDIRAPQNGQSYVAFNAMVEKTKGITYPPLLDITITSSHTEWTGSNPSDSATVSFTISNNGLNGVEVTHSKAGLEPAFGSVPITAGGSTTYEAVITEDPPSNTYTATFTITDGINTEDYTVSEVLDSKPSPLPQISLSVNAVEGDWTGSEANDSKTFTFNVQNTSDSNSLTVTHSRGGLTPSSASVSVGSTAVFTESITSRPTNGIYEVTFTGTASDGRTKQYYESFNVTEKPTPPPPDPGDETHDLTCTWFNAKNYSTLTTEHTVDGPARYPQDNCTEYFQEQYPEKWIGGDDWYLQEYEWDKDGAISVDPPGGPGNKAWPIVDLAEVMLTDGDSINENHYRQLVVMEDGGILNIPEEIDRGFQFALVCYNSPVTLVTGKVDHTTSTVPTNTIAIVSKVI